ncbi:2918_t:CDS:2 [Acaulospora morrowiae]|uniref:2918_t:CDS:1 n=1 Tax=Acaulospora morrowiae TaxID=94023 RepID=A0A9N9EHA8_9GLOM|nr:2918_t:CDS:2 [Acaulospora morrowiae]
MAKFIGQFGKTLWQPIKSHYTKNSQPQNFKVPIRWLVKSGTFHHHPSSPHDEEEEFEQLKKFITESALEPHVPSQSTPLEIEHVSLGEKPMFHLNDYKPGQEGQGLELSTHVPGHIGKEIEKQELELSTHVPGHDGEEIAKQELEPSTHVPGHKGEEIAKQELEPSTHVPGHKGEEMAKQELEPTTHVPGHKEEEKLKQES